MTSEQDPPPLNQHRQRPTEQSQDTVDTDMPDQPSVPPPSQSATATTSLPSSAAEQEQEQQQQQQPAPPPPPVPGPRAARLQALFATTAKHTLDKINKDNFGACFPTISQKAPGTLEFVQRQMVERLGSLWNYKPAQKEFETIMANRQVVARLNELEALVSDAARRRAEADNPNSPPVAPHTLPAETVLAAHLRPHLAAHRSRLDTALRDTQTANAALWDEIQAQRAEMEALLDGVDRALRDLDGANALLADDVVDELAAETRAADADVRAATAAKMG
ncbi:Nnf1-domain-containing protein [Corynascus novoguineensis]|uniref:Nnf1-domain-containing protein n=1 Tax=Corynascus novoguineensis TaxID=1126955 RepID=A0AAN7HUW1_9PEZI|nr:Nnf1-domain-containing protein [Corynascus novoguineensis]